MVFALSSIPHFYILPTKSSRTFKKTYFLTKKNCENWEKERIVKIAKRDESEYFTWCFMRRISASKSASKILLFEHDVMFYF